MVAALHHEEIGKNPHRIKKLMQYINNYNWKGIKFPAGENIHKSDYNHKPQHIVDLLMITHNQNNWHYLNKKHEKTNQRRRT